MEYKPWIGALNVHAQGFYYCLYEVLLPFLKKPLFEREILELSDGGEIALDWLVHPNAAKPFESSRHIVVLIPGVNGDSTKPYVISMTQACIEGGFNLVVVNWRGMGGVPLKVSNNLISIIFTVGKNVQWL